MSGAEDFESETKSRGEELKALAAAKKVIAETTGGAAEQSYSFVQVKMASGADLAGFEAVRFVRDLAQTNKSPALAQLASRMASTMRGSSGADVFAKVQGCNLQRENVVFYDNLLTCYSSFAWFHMRCMCPTWSE